MSAGLKRRTAGYARHPKRTDVLYTCTVLYKRQSDFYTGRQHKSSDAIFNSQRNDPAATRRNSDMEPLWVKDEKQRETQYKETLRKCDCRELIRIIKTIYHRMQSRIAEGKKSQHRMKNIFILLKSGSMENLPLSLESNATRYVTLSQKKLEKQKSFKKLELYIRS